MSIVERPLIRRMLVAFVIVAGMVLGAAPAQAAYTDCPSGYACMWTTNNYPGTPNGRFAQTMPVSIGINSIVNNGNSSVVRFYENTGCSSKKSIKLNNPARGGQIRDPMLSNGTDETTEDWSNRIKCGKFV